jgi:hypothetical protein
VATLLKTALALAAKNIAVFPCVPRDKAPAIGGGCLSATKDKNMIRHLWGQNPNYNIGVACGEISEIFVLDTDSVDAEVELRKLEAAHGEPLPPTVESITSRGRHLWFRLPAGVVIRNSAGKLGPGLDIKSTNGYVLSPPSRHPSGKKYCWSVDSAGAFATPPDWLIEKIAEHNGSDRQAAPASVWRELVLHGVAEGARDNTVTKLTGHLLCRGIDAVVVLELMQLFNAARCSPPLPAEDVDRIVNSIAGKELRKRGVHAG